MTHTKYLAAFKQLTVSLLPYTFGIFSGFFSDVSYSRGYASIPQITRESARVASGRPGLLGGAPDDDTLPIETVRTFFPETWIWDLVDVG